MNLQITFQTKFLGDVIVWGSFQLFLSIKEPFTFDPEYKYLERRNFESETSDSYYVLYALVCSVYSCAAHRTFC